MSFRKINVVFPNIIETSSKLSTDQRIEENKMLTVLKLGHSMGPNFYFLSLSDFSLLFSTINMYYN